MGFSIRPCAREDAKAVYDILREAALWLEQTGQPMCCWGEFLEEDFAPDIGDFHLASVDGIPAGTLKFLLEDELFWPDHPDPAAAYIHRLAIRRQFAGQGVSRAMLAWTLDHARSLDKKCVRLDCEAARPKLRAIYENFGFRHHSDRQVGPYFVARYEYQL